MRRRGRDQQLLVLGGTPLERCAPGFRARPGLGSSHLCLLPGTQPWVGHFVSLGLSFLIWNLGRAGAPPSSGCGEEDCAADCSSSSSWSTLWGDPTYPPWKPGLKGEWAVPQGPPESAHDYSTRGPAPIDKHSTTAPPGVWPRAGGVPELRRSLTWSNTWLLVALYFCAMASATAFGPMNSVFQL